MTRFTLQTFPQGFVWAGIRYYNRDQLPALLSAMAEYQARPDKDPEANMMIQNPVTDNAEIGAVLNFIYGKPEKEPDAFEPFANIPYMEDTMGIRTLEDFMANQIMVDPADIPRYGIPFDAACKTNYRIGGISERQLSS